MKNKLFTIVFLIACFAADAYALVGDECKEKLGWSFLQASEEDSRGAMTDLTKEAITMGQPFSFNVALCPSKDEQPERVTATAIMPAHQHWMNYTPTVTFNPEENSYKVEDFVFHMPGLWEVSISTYVGDTATHYTQNITVN